MLIEHLYCTFNR